MARDFNYVKDITSAFLNVIESQNKKIYGQDYNTFRKIFKNI